MAVSKNIIKPGKVAFEFHFNSIHKGVEIVDNN